MQEIVKKFKVNSNVKTIERYGNGHINETYLVILENNEKYILQKINKYIFNDIASLMNNKVIVTSYLKSINVPTLEIIETLDNKTFYYDNKDYYRLDKFVKNSLTLESVPNEKVFYQTGMAFGKFSKDLAKCDLTNLVDILPDFHNTIKRYEHLLETIKKDPLARVKECEKEIKFIKEREKDYHIIMDLLAANKIPYRITHNDTKLNNILFDKDTLEPICIIDLDTIMKGSCLFDFGDSIRYGCNISGENNINSSFSLSYFEAYAKGYLKELKDELNEEEIKHLAISCKILTLEVAIRFLDDYIDGNHYFNIKYAKQNLDRAKSQISLAKAIESNMLKMEAIIKAI